MEHIKRHLVTHTKHTKTVSECYISAMLAFHKECETPREVIRRYGRRR